MANLLYLAERELHHVLYADSDVDETNAVVLQPQSRECRELLCRGLLVRSLIGKSAQDYAWVVRHWGTVFHYGLHCAPI
jgi:hypothetical protein